MLTHWQTTFKKSFTTFVSYLSTHKWQLALAFLTSSLFTYGNLLQNDKGLSSFGFTSFLQLIFNFLIFYLLVALFFYILDHQTIFATPAIKHSPTSIKHKSKSHKKSPFIFCKKQFFLIWLLIFLCWLPYFLAFYPGIWAYDVDSQLHSMTTHHPIIHTLILRGCIALGRLIHSENLGIAIATLSQMLFLSGILAYATDFLRRFIHSKFAFWLLFAFFAFAPFNPIMAISATKDVFFTGFLILSIISLFIFLSLPPNSKFTSQSILFLILSLTLFMLFRNNGVYVVIIWAILILIFVAKHMKRIFLFISIASFSLYGTIFFSLYHLSGASPSSLQYEAFTVPLQIITGNAIIHPESVPSQGSFLGVDRGLLPADFSTFYHPYIGDNVKNTWSQYHPDKLAIFANWAKLSLKYPLDSLDIHSRLTLSAWHIPSDDYAHIYSNWAKGYLETAFLETDVLPTAHSASKFPALQTAVNNFILEDGWKNNFLTYLFMSPALYVWSLIFLLFYLCHHRRYHYLPILLLPLLLFFTTLFGPLVLVRYLYPIMLSAPIIYILILSTLSTFRPKKNTNL